MGLCRARQPNTPQVRKVPTVICIVPLLNSGVVGSLNRSSDYPGSCPCNKRADNKGHGSESPGFRAADTKKLL